ncbi:glycosyltransferase [Microbacterium sp. F2]|uniref:glycosyltransferase n=1 Tax=Microbacterium sp. F2 TaxID=3422228 RepID=UPI003FD5B547
MNQALRQHWISVCSPHGEEVVAMIGQLRLDKNPLLLLRSAAAISPRVSLVYAGEDKGAAKAVYESADANSQSVVLIDSYLPLESLVSLVSICDVVVCPYEIASQSGVLALAGQLGVPTVASRVGGLAEQASHTFDHHAPNADELLSGAIVAALRARRRAGNDDATTG